jgi:RNA polymerase sigma-70 factor (ECF subfamily)
MQIINLRKYYPWYTHDELVEVPDAVAEAMAESKRLEAAQRRRIYRHKAYYSLDREDGIEAEACYLNMTPHEIFEHELLRCRVCKALNSLPEQQGRRVEARFLRGMSVSEIANAEGVGRVRVYNSIERGLRNIKNFLKNSSGREYK